MQITLHAPELKSAVRAFAKVIPASVSLPSLGYIHVRGASGEAVVTATNLDETLSLRLEHAATGDQEFLLPFEELKRTAPAMGRDDYIAIEPASDRSLTLYVCLKGTSVSRTVETMPVGEFPAVTLVAPGNPAMDPGVFLSAFRATARAACTDPARAAINGILLDGAEGRLVATDGHRMSTRLVPKLRLDGSVIVPRTRLLMNGILDAVKTGTVGIGRSGNLPCLQLESGPWAYQVRCLDLTYPNWRQVVPDDTRAVQARFSVGPGDVAKVRALLEQVAGEDRAVCLYVEAGRLCAFIPTDRAEAMPSLVDLPFAAAEAGSGKVIMVNSGYLLDALETGFTEATVLDEFVPLVLRSPGFKGVYVLMPVRMAHSAELAALIGSHLHPGGTVAVPAQGQVQPPAAESATSEAEAVSPQAGGRQPAADPPTPETVLSFTPAADPVEDLLEALSQAQEHIQTATASLRVLRTKARALARDYRSRERELDARKKEVESRVAAIARLQKAVAA